MYIRICTYTYGTYVSSSTIGRTDDHRLKVTKIMFNANEHNE